MSAGMPRNYIVSAPGEACRGAFEGATFCQRCWFLKPLEAHHCRRCPLRHFALNDRTQRLSSC